MEIPLLKFDTVDPLLIETLYKSYWYDTKTQFNCVFGLIRSAERKEEYLNEKLVKFKKRIKNLDIIDELLRIRNEIKLLKHVKNIHANDAAYISNRYKEAFECAEMVLQAYQSENEAISSKFPDSDIAFQISGLHFLNTGSGDSEWKEIRLKKHENTGGHENIFNELKFNFPIFDKAYSYIMIEEDTREKNTAFVFQGFKLSKLGGMGSGEYWIKRKSGWKCAGTFDGWSS